ncbi:uncharacterized protein GLRG_06870 [Colletotrichum graminicola M1.001]|uniref:Uncharacterized protein n=1 Tax=Colletotrichum graminicola (strain M1.001 / M2 / FGSC 10212) TaxID=645133 RepID=E3QL43_COLGM|nr:uncharacterized protein GLRG_06870 [Colletotrichum graminicola M1.001]EFQ31581.1 hypothetical protein GLRG_06870 [Colletotrichum graminicola M1.001]
MKALVKLTDGDNNGQYGDQWRPKVHFAAGVSQPGITKKGSSMAETLVGAEDHLRINEDGLSLIEIL